MPVALILKKSDGFYEIPLFKKYQARAVFTARSFDMSFEARRRAGAYKKMNVNARHLVCPSQVHGDAVVRAQKKHGGRGAFNRATAISETDALVTNEKFLPLAIQTADCLPVYVFDTEKRAIALIHAGWKSLHQKIIAKAIFYLTEKFDSRPCDCVVALGPTLRSCCYEVGHEFADFFPQFLMSGHQKYHFDIIAAACDQLKAAGVKDASIHDSRICTSCMNDEFFSYRREGEKAGRSMSIFEIL